MDPIAIGALSLLAILAVIYSGVHVAVALAGVSLLGIWAIKGQFGLALSFVVLAVTESIADHNFGVVPLFVLMGIAVSESGLGRDTFAVVSAWLRGVRGGLGVATVVSNAIFAAITGISIASAAVFAKVAVPPMVAAGYSRRLAVGIVAGSSVLGMLIPPSLLLILFAVLTEVSVGDLFLGGIGPGLVLTAAYSAYLLALGRLRPELVEAAGPAGGAPVRPQRILPVLALATAVLGGIYTGYVTPTEAGAVGAALALLLAFGMGRVGARGAWAIAVQTGQVTAAVSFLIVGAFIYGRMLGFSGLPAALTAAATGAGIGPLGFLLLVSLLLVLLGTVLDSASIMLITVPLAFPIATGLGIDPVHFGLVTVIAIEIGLLTPPLGLSVFVVASTLRAEGVTLGDVFRGAAPFAGVMALVLLLVILAPGIATFLPARW